MILMRFYKSVTSIGFVLREQREIRHKRLGHLSSFGKFPFSMSKDLESVASTMEA